MTVENTQFKPIVELFFRFLKIDEFAVDGPYHKQIYKIYCSHVV